jgi:hypothetical protein
MAAITGSEIPISVSTAVSVAAMPVLSSWLSRIFQVLGMHSQWNDDTEMFLKGFNIQGGSIKGRKVKLSLCSTN